MLQTATSLLRVGKPIQRGAGAQSAAGRGGSCGRAPGRQQCVLGSRWGGGRGLAEAYTSTGRPRCEPSGPGPSRDTPASRGQGLFVGGRFRFDAGHSMGLARAEGKREQLRGGNDQELEARASPLTPPPKGPPRPFPGCRPQTPINRLGQEYRGRGRRSPTPPCSLASGHGPAGTYPGPGVCPPRLRPLPSLPPPHFASPPPRDAAMSVTGNSKGAWLPSLTTETP